MALSASFIEGAAGRILLTSHEADTPSGHAIVVLPAFGEEMNKSRRLVRDTAVRLSGLGYLVVVPDLFGCGDSEGSIEEARLDTWLDDLRAVLRWTECQGVDHVSILAVRAGAMFLEPLLNGSTFQRVVGWQPINGADTLRDLLRVRALNLRMSGQASSSPAAMLDELLNTASSMELSGYTISSELAADMTDTTTGFVESRDGFTIVEFGQASTEPGVITVGGERFWRALEPGPNEELVSATVGLFASQ